MMQMVTVPIFVVQIITIHTFFVGLIVTGIMADAVVVVVDAILLLVVVGNAVVVIGDAVVVVVGDAVVVIVVEVTESQRRRGAGA